MRLPCLPLCARALSAVVLSAAALAVAVASADAAPRRHRHLRRVVPVGYAPPPPEASSGLATLAGVLTIPLGGLGGGLAGGLPGGDAGVPIRPEAARFMGYPYNVPSYRYPGYDACLLRVGGPFGPGPSAGPCPFGLDRAF